jgi:hypothetical protein
MIVKKNKQGAGRPPKIDGAVMWRGYLSASNIAYINQNGPGNASAKLRRVLDAAEEGLLDNEARTEALLVIVKDLREQVARLEREHERMKSLCLESDAKYEQIREENRVRLLKEQGVIGG